MPAQPFREAQSGGKRKNPSRARRPHKPRQHEAETRKNRERGGQPGNAQRQGPGEFVRLDEKRRAKPPEPGQEITKAPPPADAKGAPRRDRQAQTKPPPGQHLARLRATVDEPNGNGHRDRERGEKVERRHRKCASSAGGDRDQAAPPPSGENDRSGEHVHGGLSRTQSSISIDCAKDFRAFPVGGPTMRESA